MTSSEAAHFGSDSSWGLGLHQLPVVHHSDGEAKESLLVLESNITGQKIMVVPILSTLKTLPHLGHCRYVNLILFVWSEIGLVSHGSSCES